MQEIFRLLRQHGAITLLSKISRKSATGSKKVATKGMLRPLRHYRRNLYQENLEDMGRGVSRLTDFISQAKAKYAELGKELEKEFKTLANRFAFGLNFGRHRPESVDPVPSYEASLHARKRMAAALSVSTLRY